MPIVFDHVCSRCRLAGEKLFLKGEKCFTPKCPMVRRAYRPGIHGQKRAGRGRREPRRTDYGIQLREKQTLRAMYGIPEHQLRAYFRDARRIAGVTSDHLIRRLESRLDNVVFRLGFVSSRPAARQLVHHGLITVDGRRVTVPSFQVRVGHVISINESRRGKPIFTDLADRVRGKPLPAWLERVDAWTGRVSRDVHLEPHEVPVDLGSVVEFYSR